MNKDFATLADFMACFPDEEACRAHFEAIRYEKGDYCPYCDHPKIMRYTGGKRYRCHSCRRDFTIKTGTLFGDSKLPLKKWFIAIYLLTTHKKGISSIELSKQVGVSQKTAWFMDHRIRAALKQGNNKLFGTIETDETYIGGKEHNKHAYKRIRDRRVSNARKTPIVGMFQRGGKIKTVVLNEVTIQSLEKHLTSRIKKGSNLYTDEYYPYTRLKRHFNHQTINHSKAEYVRNQVHTNTAESFWALFRRGYHGIYHSMSRKHLQRYVDEFTFRLNHRHLSPSKVLTEVLRNSGIYGTMSYKKLTTV